MYVEGDLPVLSTGNNGSGMWGQDGIWAILLLALLGNGFGYGRGGYGAGAGAGISGEALGYELGKVATTNDVASGFNNSAVLSSLNDIKLTQASNLNFINQGFAGLNNVITTGFSGVDNAICTLGYQNQQGFNTIAHQISDCCCGINRAIDGVNFNMVKNTGDIVNAINVSNQRVIDYLTSEKIDTLNRKLATAEAQLSNNAQSRYIVDTVLDKLSPCPRPAYITCNPNTGLTYPAGYTQANFGTGCSGCGSF